jgi:hypothetical protein
MDKARRSSVEWLLKDASELYQEGRFADALQAAEKASEGAKVLGDLGLEIEAVTRQANYLCMLVPPT